MQQYVYAYDVKYYFALFNNACYASCTYRTANSKINAPAPTGSGLELLPVNKVTNVRSKPASESASGL